MSTETITPPIQHLGWHAQKPASPDGFMSYAVTRADSISDPSKELYYYVRLPLPFSYCDLPRLVDEVKYQAPIGYRLA